MTSFADWTVADGEDGARLDHFVAAHAGCSHAAARRVVEGGAAKINGRRAKKGERLRKGDRVTVSGALPDAVSLRPIAQPELPLEVLLLDEECVALNKPAGIASHPLVAGELGTLANALVARYPECAGLGKDPREAGLAHRLDRDTSGVLLAARTPAAWEALRASFSDGGVRKEYLALVSGVVTAPLVIALPLAHDPRDRRRVRVVGELDDGVEEARPARTEVEPIASAGDLTLVRARAITGRMHQVRAHLAHAGHPIVGDALYGGGPLEGLTGHFLHAARIAIATRGLDVRAPLPADRAALLGRLGLPSDG